MALVPFDQTGGAMPVVDVGNGETVSAFEFFTAIQRQAPLALQHENWLRLAKMAFTENRVDALALAKEQAVQIQRGLPVGNALGGMTQYPTTYHQPHYYPPQPQPIVFQPQITINPTIAPTFQNTANPTNTSSHQAETRQTTPQPYYTTTDLNLWQFLGLLFATAAIVILVL